MILGEGSVDEVACPRAGHDKRPAIGPGLPATGAVEHEEDEPDRRDDGTGHRQPGGVTPAEERRDEHDDARNEHEQGPREAAHVHAPTDKEQGAQDYQCYADYLVSIAHGSSDRAATQRQSPACCSGGDCTRPTRSPQRGVRLARATPFRPMGAYDFGMTDCA